MSLQEAASSGSFNPRAAQPSEPQRVESPFHASAVEDTVDQALAEPSSPFGNPYEFSAGSDDAIVDAGEPDMHASRRRAWTVVSLAIVIPAAVAGIIAWQLFGSEAEPAPIVTRVTTTPASTAATQVGTATTAPVEASASARTDTAASAVESTTQAAVVTTSTQATVAATDTTEAAAVAAEPAVDLASLDPAARLAAWTDIETIQVLPGETLWLIAQNYNTTISAIATLNNINDPATLSIGQQLMIPVGFTEEIVETPIAVAEGSEPVATDDGSLAITAASIEAPALTDELTNWHTIAPVSIEEGDSLAAIADANSTTVEAIMALNGIADANLILIGDTLLVPVGYQGDAGSVNLTEQQTQLETGGEATATESSDDMMQEAGADASGGEGDEDMLEQ